MAHYLYNISTQYPLHLRQAQDDLKDAALWTPQEDLVPDRPRSPWTPSYSVTTQGSPLHDTADLIQDEPLPSVALVNDRAIASTVVPSAHTSVEHNQPDEPFLTAKDRVENPTSALESSKVEEFTNKSFGILEVPSNPLLVIQNLSSEADDNTINPLALGDEHGVEKTFNIFQHSPTISASESEAVTDVRVVNFTFTGIDNGFQQTLQETTAVFRLTPQEDPNQDRPKSPWTPSYSVTRQGSGLLDDSIDDEEIGGLEPLPDRAVDHLADIAQVRASLCALTWSFLIRFLLSLHPPAPRSLVVTSLIRVLLLKLVLCLKRLQLRPSKASYQTSILYQQFLQPKAGQIHCDPDLCVWISYQGMSASIFPLSTMIYYPRIPLLFQIRWGLRTSVLAVHLSLEFTRLIKVPNSREINRQFRKPQAQPRMHHLRQMIPSVKCSPLA